MFYCLNFGIFYNTLELDFNTMIAANIFLKAKFSKKGDFLKLCATTETCMSCNTLLWLHFDLN